MKTSIQTKFLATCIVLVLFTAAGISSVYYLLTRQDKQRETQERMVIAVDILLDELNDAQRTFQERLSQFLQTDAAFGGQVFMLNKQLQRRNFDLIGTYMEKVADQLRTFGRQASANRLLLYGADKKLLAVYQHEDNLETYGIYLPSQSAESKYLPLDNALQITAILMGDKPVPDNPLPFGVTASYDGPIPAAMTSDFITEDITPGFRILAPVPAGEGETGVLLADTLYTQNTLEQAALLSKAHLDVFVKNQRSLGTLGGYPLVETEDHISCERVMAEDAELEAVSLTVNDIDYYQGQCRITNSEQHTIGLIAVSLSQEIAKKATARVLKIVLVIAGIVCVAASGVSLLVSRTTIHAIQDIVRVISAASDGDLRETVKTMTHDEIGMLSLRLNQMIGQLRHISTDVQQASYAVSTTADTILSQMAALVQHMELQSTSVDNTTASIETIDHFIDAVAQNTNELLSASAQILSSMQETRASLEEVAHSTQSLTTNLQRISSSVAQVNQATKQIDRNVEQLEQTAQQTDTEIGHIDQSFRNASENANQTQELAKETMDAAISAQTSVNASLQGMTELKDVVSNTADIIQEVNTWGEQVSSILGIVDEITGQTALLSLNASIISAQAGVHGRGFAVVAAEIKELADRTKNSTKEIANLVHALQAKTEEGVKNIQEGLQKADQGMLLTNAVRDALGTILDSATRSSKRAADTADVIRQTADSSRIISTSMNSVTEMVSQIRSAIQEQAEDVEEVVEAVENISGMAEQVNHANIEQKKAAGEVERSMTHVTERFNRISDQTEELKSNSQQIVEAMHTVETTTEQILHNANTISGDTVKNLVQQSELLQKIVGIFKVS